MIKTRRKLKGYSRFGNNCLLHSDTCIDNDNETGKIPIIRDNIIVGVNAIVNNEATTLVGL